MFKSIYRLIDSFFDKLEDVVRGKLSKHSIIYAFIGGSGIILFWRGIWHSADWLQTHTQLGSILFSPCGSMVCGVSELTTLGASSAVPPSPAGKKVLSARAGAKGSSAGL